MTQHYVFVYGTLKRGFPLHGALAYSKFISQEQVNGILLNLGSFPGLVPVSSDVVHGELYHVSDKTLKSLDFIEGHPNFYRRQQLNLLRGGGFYLPCVWGYCLSESYLQEAHYPRIVSGNWTGPRST